MSFSKDKLFYLMVFTFYLLGNLLSPQSFAATYTVINCADSGAGSLRQAITDANSNAGADTIEFNIPTTDGNYHTSTSGNWWKIHPDSVFPSLTDAGTAIMGGTQTTNQGDTNLNGPEIEIDGSSAGVVDGFSITTSNCTIEGLVLNGFNGDARSAILISGTGANANEVIGNYIGTDVAGAAADANTYGVYIGAGARFNIIGGTTAAHRNIISSNSSGVIIYGTNTDSNEVKGNYIGTDKNGTADLGNTIVGVVVEFGARFNIVGGTASGARNIISGQGNAGVIISQSGTNNNEVIGNYIGTNASGSSAIANDQFGVDIFNGAQFNIVGGTTAAHRNIISGNNYGVYLHETGTNSNEVKGNYIGTDLNGTADLGNTGDGIHISSGSRFNIIGVGFETDVAAHKNIISGNNSDGVGITGSTTSKNMVKGNSIGVDVNGAALGNSGSGVRITDGANNNTIGGTFFGVDKGNIIANNTGDGVELLGSATDNNYISTNSIYANGGLGIDLDPNGVGATGGSNNDLALPTISYAGYNSATGATTVSGTSTASVSIEVFVADLDPTGYGEGRTYLTYTTADGSGNWSLSIAGLTAGTTLTATARDSSDNTSEFSRVVTGESVVVTAPNGGESWQVNSSQNITWTSTGTIANVKIEYSKDNFASNVNTIVSSTTNDGSYTWTVTNDASSVARVRISNAADANCLDISNADFTLGADPFVVTNTSDSGTGSLRWAMTNANTTEGYNTITFSIPTTDSGYNAATGAWTIEPTTSASLSGLIGAFPILTDNGTYVNATTQPGYGGSPLIVIAGTNVGASKALASNTDGFVINTANCTIEGFVVNRFYRGILITGSGADNNRIMGNYLGTDATGTVALANTLAGVGIDTGAKNNTIGGTTAAQRNIISGNTDADGINIGGANTNSNEVKGNYIGTNVNGTAALANRLGCYIYSGAAFNIIGGTTAGERNIISGNNSRGIAIGGPSGANSNEVKGNYIGTDVNGTADLGNTDSGVRITSGSQYNIIGGTAAGARNIISGNNNNGVDIDSTNTNSNEVLGNYIGTDVNGTAALANSSSGVFITSAAKYNIIGGTTEGARNVISGNTTYGIVISGSGSDGNTVLGNYIGTDMNGTADLGNSNSGIAINQAASNIVGGSTAAARNIISGNNASGIDIFGIGTTANQVKGNYIGTDKNGTAALGNSGAGIYLTGSAQSNIIGATSVDTLEANLIAYNGADGVYVAGSDEDFNRISRNSIFQNTGLGIDLGTNGVGGTSGANGDLSMPTISYAGYNSVTGATTVSGTSAASASIEVFVADLDPTGYGEGRTYLTYTTADGSGNWSVSIAGLTAATTFTATAIDSTNNTSEFSRVVTGESIVVTAPNGGESWQANSSQNITWTSTGTIANVKIEYSKDNFVSNVNTIVSSTTNDGSYTWTVTNDASSTVSVRISNAADANCLDISNADFTITADTTAPGNISGFTAVAGDAQAILSWTNPADSDFSAVIIAKSSAAAITWSPTTRTSYSEGDTVATGVTILYKGRGTSKSDTGLTNGTTYYYKGFAYDEVPNYASGVTAVATPLAGADITAPSNVTGFSVTVAAAGNQLDLSWTNPTESDFSAVIIAKSSTAAITWAPTSGTSYSEGATVATGVTILYKGSGTSKSDTSLTDGTTYYYKIISYDTSYNYPSGASGSGVPADITAPGNILSFSATAGDGQITLSWTNPSDSDYAGVMIRYRIDTHPTSISNGTLATNKTGAAGAAESVIHSGLTNGTSYYYAAFAYDEVPNYASGLTAIATPAAGAISVSSLSPASLPLGLAARIRVIGTNLGSAAWVDLTSGSTTLTTTNVTTVSATLVEFSIDLSSQGSAGTYNVVLKDSGGVTLYTFSNAFVITAAGYTPAWAVQTMGADYRIKDLAVLSESIVYAAGEGVLAKTSDGGSSWTIFGTTHGIDYTALNTLAGGTFTFNAVGFWDTLTGWAGGSNGIIYKTVNGGTSWTQLTPVSTGRVVKIQPQSAVKVWVALSGVGGSAEKVIFSSEGGSSWSAVGPTELTDDVLGLYFATENIGWVVGKNGKIYKTSDAGLSWTPQTSPVPENLNEVYFIDTSRGWIGGDSGKLLSTTNGGSSWSTVTAYPGTGAIKALQFITSNWGFAGGVGSPPGGASWQIYETRDAGASWTTHNVSGAGSDTCEAIAMLNSGLGWAAGSMLKYSGTAPPHVLLDFQSGSAAAGDVLRIEIAGSGLQSTHTAYLQEDSSGSVLTADSVVFKSARHIDAVFRIPSDAAISDNWTLKVGDTLRDSLPFTTKFSIKAAATEARAWNVVPVHDEEPGSFYALGTRGISEITVVGDAGQAFTTANAGSSWTSSAPALAAGADFRGYYKDPEGQVVVIMGSSGQAYLERNSSWSVIQDPAVNRLYAISGVDSANIWIAAGGGRVLKLNVGTEATFTVTNATDSDKHFTDIYFPSATVGFASRIDRPIFKTGDGATWSRVGSIVGSTSVAINACYFVDPSYGGAVDVNGRIYRTIDGGVTWTQQTAADVALNDIYFIDRNRAWAVGNGGLILKTTNGGDTWSTEVSGVPFDLMSIKMVSSTYGWVCGNSNHVLRYGYPPGQGISADVDPPAAFTVTGQSVAGGIYLNWSAARDNVGLARYEIKRGPAEDALTHIGTTAATVTRYTDSALTPQTSYAYKVLAIDRAGNQWGSNVVTVSFIDTSPPTASVISAVGAQTSVTLTWTAASDASGIAQYKIYRYSGETLTQIATSMSLTYTDSSLAVGVYRYAVAAVDNNGWSALSNIAEAGVAGPIPDTSPPPAVTTLVAVVGETVVLSWAAPTWPDEAGGAGTAGLKSVQLLSTRDIWRYHLYRGSVTTCLSDDFSGRPDEVPYRSLWMFIGQTTGIAFQNTAGDKLEMSATGEEVLLTALNQVRAGAEIVNIAANLEVLATAGNTGNVYSGVYLKSGAIEVWFGIGRSASGSSLYKKIGNAGWTSAGAGSNQGLIELTYYYDGAGRGRIVGNYNGSPVFTEAYNATQAFDGSIFVSASGSDRVRTLFDQVDLGCVDLEDPAQTSTVTLPVTAISYTDNRVESGRQYYYNCQAEDLAGNRSNPSNYMHVVMADRGSPLLIARVPDAAREGSVSSSTWLRFTFSERMNTQSVESAFSIEPAITYSVDWDERQFIVQPVPALAENITYRVRISSAARDLIGNSLTANANSDFEFRTIPDNESPVAGDITVTTSGGTPAHVLRLMSAETPRSSLLSVLNVFNPRISGVAQDRLSEIVTIEARIDGVQLYRSDSGLNLIRPTDGSFNSTREAFYFYPEPLADGTHAIIVRAFDRAGNPSATSTASFIIDVRTDSTEIPTQVRVRVPTERGIETHEIATQQTATVTVSAVSTSEIVGQTQPYKVVIAVATEETTRATTSLTANVDSTGGFNIGLNNLTDGRYTVTISIANLDQSARQTVVSNLVVLLDTTKPTLSVLVDDSSIINGDVVTANPTIKATVQDTNKIQSVTMLVDGLRVSPTVVSSTENKQVLQYTVPAPGLSTAATHSITVTATDETGNTGTWQATGLKVYEGRARLIGSPLNYPNPFKPKHGEKTTIAYSLTVNDEVTLYIYDITGTLILKRIYTSGITGGKAGYNEITWDGINDFGEIVQNGVFLYRLVVDNKVINTVAGKIAVLD